jgi:hypothetical protein
VLCAAAAPAPIDAAKSAAAIARVWPPARRDVRVVAIRRAML